MFRLVLVCALAVSAFADVSHIVGGGGLPASPFPFQRASPAPVANFAPNYQRPIAILRQSQDIQPNGGYQYSYQTENGINAEQTGQVRAVGNELENSAQGSYSYTSPEGEQVSVVYVADSNGYQPQGSHLPVAPPVPEAIQRALAWIAAHPEPVQQPQRRF